MLSNLVHLLENILWSPPVSLAVGMLILAGVLMLHFLPPTRRPRRVGRQQSGRSWQRRNAPWRPHHNQPLRLQESAIEETFRLTWSTLYPQMPLEQEYPIGPYRADFVHLASQVVIELDGFVAHSSTRQIENDCRRQRELMRRGWQVFRFGGREVHFQAQRCVQEAHAFILQQQKPLPTMRSNMSYPDGESL